MRTAVLNTKIAADTSAVKSKIADLGKEQVKIPVSFDTSNLKGIKTLTTGIVRIDGDGSLFGTNAARELSKVKLQANLPDYIGSRLADSIAKQTGSAVGDAVKKATSGNLFGAITGLIGQAISIPLKAVSAVGQEAFRGVVFGATQAASAELGQGISAGLQKVIGTSIGSPELIGRKIAETYINAITKGVTAVAGEANVSTVQSAVTGFLGEREVVTDSRAKSAQERQVQERRQELAREQANRERQEAARAQLVATEQASKRLESIKAVEAEFVKENAPKAAQIKAKIQKLDTKPLDDQRKELRALYIKQLDGVAQQAKEFEESAAKEKAEFNRINSQRPTEIRSKKSKEFEEQQRQSLSEFTKEQKPIAIKAQQRLTEIDDSRLTQDEKKLREYYFKQLNEIEDGAKALKDLKQGLVVKLKSVLEAQKQATQVFDITKGGDAYAKVLDGQIADLRKEEDQIQKAISDRQNVIRKGLELLEKVSDNDAKTVNLYIKKAAEEINQNLVPQSTRLEERRANLESTRQQVKPDTPQAVLDILKELTGRDFLGAEAPELIQSDRTLPKTTGADYVPEANAIRLRKDLLDALNAAKKTEDLTSSEQYLTREELFHALQFDFGSEKGLKAFERKEPLVKVPDITQEEVLQKADTLNKYYSPEVRQIELEAKVASQRGTLESLEKKKREEAESKLFKQTGFAGTAGSEQAQKLQAQVTRKAQELEDSGVDPKIGATINKALGKVEVALSEFANDAALTATGTFDSAKVQKISAQFSSIVSSLVELDSTIDYLQTEIKPTIKVAAPLAVVQNEASELGQNIQRLGSTLAPAASVVGDGIEFAAKGLTVVGKAGLALADKLGFAAASLIPGGAIAYGPAKAAIKTAATAGAAGAIATQVPEAAQLIHAITGALTTIISPATTGIATSVGHSVSAEIAGALPALFGQLTRVVAESGLPGSQVTAVAVEKLGGGLTHLLEPIISGVANTADGAIVSVGHAVNEFLGQVGGLLIAGKGVQEGVKLATSKDARAAALNTIQTVGSGIGEISTGVGEGVEKARAAVDRTKRALSKDSGVITDAIERISQGEINAIGDLKEAAESAASNVQRGVGDVARATGQGVGRVASGAKKIADVTLSGVVKGPDGFDVNALGKDALIGLARQIKAKAIKAIEAEVEAAGRGNAAGTGRAGNLKSDLNKILGLLLDKFDDSIETYAVQVDQEFGDLLPELRPRLKLPQAEPIEVKQQPIEAKALKLEIPKTTVTVEVDEVELDIPKVKPPTKTDQFRAAIAQLDEARDAKIDEIRATYAELKKDVGKSKTAAKRGDVLRLNELQTEIARKRDKILSSVADLEKEASEILTAFDALGVETQSNSPIRDKVAALRTSLTKTRKGTEQQVAATGKIEGADFDSLQSINIEPLKDSISDGAKSLSGALKSLVDTIFEVRGETLTESLKQAAVSPRGKDLIVNGAGLAAGVAAGTQGPVAGLAGDLVGALAARQSLGGGGPETFGDITGFLAGNITNKITGIPGSGALSASAIVPQLQKLREQIQAKYGQPLEVEIPLDLGFESLQSIDSAKAKYQKELADIDAMIAEIRRLESEGKGISPTLGDRIRDFFGSFNKADQSDIDLGLLKIETELESETQVVVEQLDDTQKKIIKETDEAVLAIEKGIKKLEESIEAFDDAQQKVEFSTNYASALNEISPEGEVKATFESAKLTDAEKLEETLRRIAELERQLDKKLGTDKPVAPTSTSKALIPIESNVPKPEEISKALIEIEQVEKGLITAVDAAKEAQKTAKSNEDELIKLTEQLQRLKKLRDELQQATALDRDIKDLGVGLSRQRPSAPISKDLSYEQRVEQRKPLDTPTGDTNFDEQVAKSQAATAKIEQNLARFNAVQSRINAKALGIDDGALSKTQKAYNAVGDGVQKLREKLEENGGISGVLGKAKKSLYDFAESAGLSVGILTQLGNTIKGVAVGALAFVAINSISDALITLGRTAFDASAKYEALQKRLEFTRGSAPKAAEDFKFIESESDRLNIKVNELAESFTQLRVATKSTNIEGEKTKELFSAVNNLGTVSGLTAENIKSVYYQLGQTIRLGRAQGDELRSISDAGININAALAKGLGVADSQIQGLIEKGEVSAIQVTDALISLGKEAESGLPAALQTSEKAMQRLQKKLQDGAKDLGDFIKPGVVAGINAIGVGLDLLNSAGQKFAPITSAISAGLQLIYEIGAPIVGLIGSIVSAVGSDLATGFVVPFQAIGAGLQSLVENAQTVKAAFSGVATSVGSFLSQVPGLSLIAEYANPATLAVQALGFAIGVYAVAQGVQLAVTIGGAVQAALVGLYATITTSVIPALIAANISLGPIAIGLAAIGLASVVLGPQIDKVGYALQGMDKNVVEIQNKAIGFGSKYQEALDKLHKKIPLTVNEMAELKKGFDESVKAGVDSAGTADILKKNLDKLQLAAEQAAKAQAILNKEIKDSETAYKSASNANDNQLLLRKAEILERQAGNTKDANAAQMIALKDQEQAERKAYETSLELAKKRKSELESQISRANITPLDVDPTKAKDAKQKLEDELLAIDKSVLTERANVAQKAVQVEQKAEADRVKQVENAQKVVSNLVEAGLKNQTEGDIEISNIKEKELQKSINRLDRQLVAERSANGELSDLGKTLYSERQVLESELTKAVAQEAEKRREYALKEMEVSRSVLADRIAASEIQTSTELQRLLNNGLINQKEFDAQKLDATKARLQKELALALVHLKDLESLPDSENPEKTRENQKQIRDAKLKTGQLTQQLAEQETQAIQKNRELAIAAIEERAKVASNSIAELDHLNQAIDVGSKIITDALTRQNNLLSARKDLQGALSGLLDAEYKILIDSEKDEKKKAQTQENAAKFRLDSLKQSQALEREILDLQLKQEAIQSRVAIAKAQSNLAKSDAEIAKAKVEEEKVLANPESTDAEKRAAALGVRGAELGRVAASTELGGFVEAGRAQDELSKIKKDAAGIRDRQALLGAQFELANVRVDPDRKEREINQLRNESARDIRANRNRFRTPQERAGTPDYSQIDSAQRQLGLIGKDVKLGQLLTPVDLHSGVDSTATQNLGDFQAELKQLRDLTSAGVVGNLVQLVNLQNTLNTQLSAIANRPRIEQTVNNIPAPPRRGTILKSAGIGR